MKDLYNKKYVYFDWDDSLNGKFVFGSDSIASIKTLVNDPNMEMEYICSKSLGDSEKPFTLKKAKGEGSHRVKFVYYDPMLSIKRDFYRSEKPLMLQVKADTGKWINVIENYADDIIHGKEDLDDHLINWREYRLVETSAPYVTTVDQLLRVYRKHYGHQAEGFTPLIWLKDKKSGDLKLIDAYSHSMEQVHLAGDWLEVKVLHNYGYTLANGIELLVQNT